MIYDYDIAVIGGGPGGYVAAIKAAQRGKKTCIIESTYIGGTCLNVGCIPTKTLIRSANLLHEVKESAKFGITGVAANQIGVDMKAVQTRKEGVVKQLTQGVKSLLTANGAKIITGSARFIDEHTISIGGNQITAQYFIIATGSTSVMPSFITLEGANHILTSTEMLSLNALPQTIAIIGGGVIGVEFAYLLHNMGVKVTVIELMEHILPMVDHEISDRAKKRLSKDGVVFHLGARVEKICDDAVHFTVGAESKSVKADMVFMAVGRAPYTEGLDAGKIGIAFERNAIKVDAQLRTNIPHIFAIGDVNGKVMLAHTASAEAETVVDCICGNEKSMRYDRIPSCIYLEPEIACIGLTEAQAREQYGDRIQVGKFPAIASGKALVEGDTDGMYKMILHGEYGEILGAHFYGPHATEMIAEIALAMQTEATADEIIDTIHPHPTVSEMIRETVLAAWTGKAIHNL